MPNKIKGPLSSDARSCFPVPAGLPGRAGDNPGICPLATHEAAKMKITATTGPPRYTHASGQGRRPWLLMLPRAFVQTLTEHTATAK